jgi:hypothetical protein
MKRWAKVLLVVGIVWIVLVVFFMYFQCNKMLEDCVSRGGCGIYLDCHDYRTYLMPLLVGGIPSWIMFVIVGIWGRSR